MGENLTESIYNAQYEIEITPLTVYIEGGNRLNAYSKPLVLNSVIKDIDKSEEN